MFTSFGSTALGLRHHLKNQENQDAYFTMNSPIQMLCVADGHGGEKHFRSKEGAQLAIEAAREVLLEYMDRFEGCSGPNDLVFLIENDLSFDLHHKWLEKLDYDAVEYGTTLLVSFIWNSFIYFMQLGDGRCAVVYQSGDVCLPIHEDDRFIDNQTASMADSQAWLEFKVASLELRSDIAIIGLFTDGVVNAYPGQAYDDVVFYRALGENCAEESITSFLPDALALAASYSKDDATASLFVREGLQSFEQLEEPSITVSKLPESWVPLVQMLKNESLYKRVEAGHLVLNAMMRETGLTRCNDKLSVKRVYYNQESQEIELVCNPGNLQDQMKLLETIIDGRPVRTAGLETWKGARSRLLDCERSFQYCYNCGKPVEALCSLCSTNGFYGIKIVGANGTFVLQHDSKVFLHHIMPIVGGYDPVIGEVVQHPKKPMIWGIRNRSNLTWRVLEPVEREILSKDVLKLTARSLTIEVYGVNIKIFL